MGRGGEHDLSAGDNLQQHMTVEREPVQDVRYGL